MTISCANPHSQQITKYHWRVHRSNMLGVIIQADGRRKYVIRCPECDLNLGTPTHAIADELIRRGYSPVIIRINSPSNYSPCAYRDCGNPGIDRHHWAPRNVFGIWDCDNWPVSFLCKDHHREWHNRMDGYQRNAKRPDTVAARDESNDSNIGLIWQANKYAERPPEWGSTALDPLYRLQTLRDADDLLLSYDEILIPHSMNDALDQAVGL